MIDKIYIGQTREQVEKTLIERKQKYRYTRIDEESFYGTCDYDLTRLNLTIDNGIITAVKRG